MSEGTWTMTDSEFYGEMAKAWRKGERAATLWQHRHDRGDNPDDPKCPYDDGVDGDVRAIGRKVHECRPQPNMCLHVAHNSESSEYWEVKESPGYPAHYYGR